MKNITLKKIQNFERFGVELTICKIHTFFYYFSNKIRTNNTNLKNNENIKNMKNYNINNFKKNSNKFMINHKFCIY